MSKEILRYKGFINSINENKLISVDEFKEQFVENFGTVVDDIESFLLDLAESEFECQIAVKYSVDNNLNHYSNTYNFVNSSYYDSSTSKDYDFERTSINNLDKNVFNILKSFYEENKVKRIHLTINLIGAYDNSGYLYRHLSQNNKYKKMLEPLLLYIQNVLGYKLVDTSYMGRQYYVFEKI